MNREEWEALIGNPGWDAMKRYLMDFRQKLTDGVMDGNIRGVERDEAIVRAQNLRDLAEMDWATIAKFYDIETKETA